MKAGLAGDATGQRAVHVRGDGEEGRLRLVQAYVVGVCYVESTKPRASRASALLVTAGLLLVCHIGELVA